MENKLQDAYNPKSKWIQPSDLNKQTIIMDERDYKAMNKELMSYEESRKYLISEGLDPDQIAKEGMVFIKTVKENLELKKQLKEKEDQLTKSNEMAEKIETYIQEWLSVCEKTSEQVLDKHQSIKLANTTAVLLTIKEFLNSKK